MTDVTLHPDVVALAPLLGTWVGSGEGHYPTIEPFSYREEATFGHVGKPFVAYRHATRLATGLPGHAESGYLRGVGGDRLELVLVHPSGLAELAEGTVTGTPGGPLVIHLVADHVARTATAKEVTRIERTITVTGDVLRYDVSMAAVGQPHQHHLGAELHRSA